MPEKSKGISITSVKNWLLPSKNEKFQRMPESFLRSIRRRSLRNVKRTKSFVLNEKKRNSDSFVNSQEWTLSRTVPDLRLGIVGSLSSGKSALVHRYLTGSYMQEESPEGGRFKKEILVDNQSYLLLIRDEGGPPELQFTAWVDAVIFVFSLENESSFNAIYNYYTKMSHYRNSAEIPLILVGTQDAISENNPRVIDDGRARKLAADLKRCSYYETCATYGLNVERVFQDACQKIVQQRLSASASCLTPTNSRPSTPIRHQSTNGHAALAHKDFRQCHTLSASTHHLHDKPLSTTLSHAASSQHLHPAAAPTENNNLPKDLPTPSSTPTAARKSRRRSNLFNASAASKKGGGDKIVDFGSGRAIPLKQGYLYKRSIKTLNKEWKKKYVTLCDDGRLTYHPSLHDYMDDVHGKEISLQYVTVKVPGQKPRGSHSIVMGVAGGGAALNDSLGGLTLKSRLGAEEGAAEENGGAAETPHVKKRHRRMKSSGVKSSELDDPDGYEFYIVSLDNKQWHFEASSCDDRDEWVAAIEQQILNSLQLNETSKSSKTTKQNNAAAMATIQVIRSRVPGNGFCVDCDAANPDWASLNLGVLMCIECSGIHRNLGSHISRVRSLDLDEWPPGHLSVMLAIGNHLANSVWEHTIQAGLTSTVKKPTPASSREQKERFIRAKYETKEFLPPPPPPGTPPLVEAVCAADMAAVVRVLAAAPPHLVNGTVAARDLRTPLHLACAGGNLAVAQLLIWHNADVTAVDQDGRTCLAYARAAASIAAAKAQQSGGSATAAADLAAARSLVDLLAAYGCHDNGSGGGGGGGTLPRQQPQRRGSSHGLLPSSVI